MPVYTVFSQAHIHCLCGSLSPSHKFLAIEGAIALNNIKTRLPKPHKNDMPEALLQVVVNGPASTREEAGKIVYDAVA